MTRMGNAELDGVLAGLSASFDAAIDRADSSAAEDLAFSLLQDEPAARSLLQRGAAFVRLPGGHRAEVAHVGWDFVAIDGPQEVFVPLSRAVIACEDGGRPPSLSEDALTGVMRRWAREGALVEIETDVGPLRGYIVKSASDHVMLHDRKGSLVVGREAVLSVRVLPGS